MTPSTSKCECGKPAVGTVSNLVVIKGLCNAHWWAHKKKLDAWMLKQEEKQWGAQEWYINPMINRLCKICRKPIRNDLKRLSAKYHCMGHEGGLLSVTNAVTN